MPPETYSENPAAANSLEQLLQSESNATRVRKALNILLEAPYFYRDDDRDIFIFLQRYKRQFSDFFNIYYGWRLIIDSKCARLYKPQWYNEKITAANRDCFNFTRRDDCIAFMLLLEFFEKRLEEEALTIDDNDNLRFRFGDLLEYQKVRLHEIFPEATANYSDEDVRRLLRRVMPTLERYRFLTRIKPPQGEVVRDDQLIYEALPALWHYNAEQLARPLDSLALDDDTSASDNEEVN